MKPSIFLTIVLLSVAHPVWALETWEVCLDRGDFSLNADTFLKSNRVTKSGCDMRFVELGGKGTKFQLNLCDPNIRIDQFKAIDSESYDRFYAGSTGCPAPLFGADFGVTKKGAVEFEAAKKKVFEIFQAMKKVYAPKATSADAERARQPGDLTADVQLSCAEILLKEYLENCVSFEAKPKEVKPQETSNIPGVLPRIIPKKP